MEKKSNYFVLEELSKDISEEEIKTSLKNRGIEATGVEINSDSEKAFAKVLYNVNDVDLTKIEELEGQDLKDSCKFRIRFTEGVCLNELSISNKFNENEIIPYNMKYHEHIGTQFIQAPGDPALKFIDQKTIDKQRGVLKHFLSKIGSNILSGSGIMNVSLPINIFDERSLLEVFAHQARLAPYFLEKAGEMDSPIEKLKMTTAYAISRIHLSVTQLKPFNPIWGETFQCKIGETNMYLEQSSHHPPTYHFYHLGKNFKSYGFHEAEAATGANSVTARTKGYYKVEYPDGTIHRISCPTLVVGGTVIGDRTFSVIDKFFITDEKNDFISYIEFNPDERGTLAKMFSKKNTFPDYIKGCITRLSQTTFKDGNYTLNKNHTSFVEIKGEWSKNLYFDDELAWDYNDYVHFDMLRMKFTLPSDSTIREDLALLKNGDVDAAGQAKVKLEELQRKDRRLRSKHSGKDGHH